jgi:hypothetical protein
VFADGAKRSIDVFDETSFGLMENLSESSRDAKSKTFKNRFVRTVLETDIVPVPYRSQNTTLCVKRDRGNRAEARGTHRGHYGEPNRVRARNTDPAIGLPGPW